MTVLVALAGANVARAQQRDQREIHAQELFVLGRYQDALEIYGKLYAETNHPTYLRNIGRCYQKIGDPDKALDSLREFLQKAKNLLADQRETVEGYICDMQALNAKRDWGRRSTCRPSSVAARASSITARTCTRWASSCSRWYAVRRRSSPKRRAS